MGITTGINLFREQFFYKTTNKLENTIQKKSSTRYTLTHKFVGIRNTTESFSKISTKINVNGVSLPEVYSGNAISKQLIGLTQDQNISFESSIKDAPQKSLCKISTKIHAIVDPKMYSQNTISKELIGLQDQNACFESSIETVPEFNHDILESLVSKLRCGVDLSPSEKKHLDNFKENHPDKLNAEISHQNQVFKDDYVSSKSSHYSHHLDGVITKHHKQALAEFKTDKKQQDNSFVATTSTGKEPIYQDITQATRPDLAQSNNENIYENSNFIPLSEQLKQALAQFEADRKQRNNSFITTTSTGQEAIYQNVSQAILSDLAQQNNENIYENSNFIPLSEQLKQALAQFEADRKQRDNSFITTTSTGQEAIYQNVSQAILSDLAQQNNENIYENSNFIPLSEQLKQALAEFEAAKIQRDKSFVATTSTSKEAIDKNVTQATRPDLAPLDAINNTQPTPTLSTDAPLSHTDALRKALANRRARIK